MKHARFVPLLAAAVLLGGAGPACTQTEAPSRAPEEAGLEVVGPDAKVGIRSFNPTEMLQVGEFTLPEVSAAYVKIATPGLQQAPLGPKLAGIKLRHFDEEHGFTIVSVEADRAAGLRFNSMQDGVETTRLYIGRADGNVGIGTEAPQQRLEVNAVLRLTPTDAPGACGSAVEGSMYYDASAHTPCYCNGTEWTRLDGGGECR